MYIISFLKKIAIYDLYRQRTSVATWRLAPPVSFWFVLVIWPPFAEPLLCQRVELSEQGSPEFVASPAIEPVRLSACQSILFDGPKAAARSKELSAQCLVSKDTAEPVVPRLPR